MARRTGAIERLDTLALLADLPQHKLKRGEVGTVVALLAPLVYKVEFRDPEGQPYAELTLRSDQVVPLHNRGEALHLVTNDPTAPSVTAPSTPDFSDPYWKLRPEWPTPEDELCACKDEPPIVVQDHLSSLPIACLKCNGETLPEKIGFSSAIAQKLAEWRGVHRAFITLWLDSGEYETWAASELGRPDAGVNVSGRQVAAELNAYRRTYFWWFQDGEAQDFVPLSSCPLCTDSLVEAFGRLVCDPCSVVIPNG